MTRCAICGKVLEDDISVKEQYTGSELLICSECDSKLAAVKDTAQDLDDANYTAACESLMQDDRKGRSEAASKLLDTFCKKCKNPNYNPSDEEPNSFIEQIQEAMEKEDKEIYVAEKTLVKSSLGLITRVLGLLIFIGGAALSIFLGFEYRHISYNYVTGNTITGYNFAIAVFGSLAFFICGVLVMAIGEYFYQQSLRTQMMEKLYYKLFDKLDDHIC